MNAMIILMSGILKIGELNIGISQKNLLNMLIKNSFKRMNIIF